jgi:7-cyano-7-deazaguanine synthase in queuosine biosynthesis
MKPILSLLSGGFDSVIMLHELREHYPQTEIHTLFFDYGQISMAQERHCAEAVSKKLQCEYHDISVPKITWTKNDFYKNDFDVQEQYLEMRNLIFLSYALSLCESIGADRLYAAFMKPPPMNSGYNDASVEFVKRFNDLSVYTSGVKFFAPLMEYEKEDLISWVAHYKITPKDFFSCDVPVNGERCGKCGDCLTLKKIYRNY